MNLYGTVYQLTTTTVVAASKHASKRHAYKQHLCVLQHVVACMRALAHHLRSRG